MKKRTNKRDAPELPIGRFLKSKPLGGNRVILVVIPRMASGATIHDLYGIWGDRVLTISQYPRTATIRFKLKERPQSMVLKNPEPYEAVARVCDDECCGIRIVDRNIEEPNCLEFGRYRVELWTEDNMIAQFLVDGFGLSGEG